MTGERMHECGVPVQRRAETIELLLIGHDSVHRLEIESKLRAIG